MCCHGRAAWGRLAVPVPGLCPGGGTCCLLTWKVSAGGLARRGDSWGRSQPQHRPSRLLPGGGFLHPSAGSPAQGQPGDRASSAGHRCPRWARTGTGRAGRAPHLGAMLTAPMGSRAGLCSVLHNGMSRGSPAAQETQGGGERWLPAGCPRSSTPWFQRCPDPAPHSSTLPMARPTALVPCAQHREGSPARHRGANVSPRARQSGDTSLGRALELSSVPEAQPRGQATEGMAVGVQGRGPRAPQHSHLWLAWAPLSCLASKDSPAGHNLLLHIPVVLSRLPWHGCAESI